jgi:hypothetical protein
MASAFLAIGGALAALATVIALFFWRYWGLTRDRLFVFFAAAFALMGLNWASLAALDPASEARPYLYLLRLGAFVLIAIAIVDKNRRAG